MPNFVGIPLHDNMFQCLQNESIELSDRNSNTKTNTIPKRVSAPFCTDNISSIVKTNVLNTAKVVSERLNTCVMSKLPAKNIYKCEKKTRQ